MSLLQRSRFETFSGMAFLFQVLKAVPKRGNAVLRSKVHECRQWRLAELRRAPEPNGSVGHELSRG